MRRAWRWVLAGLAALAGAVVLVARFFGRRSATQTLADTAIEAARRDAKRAKADARRQVDAARTEANHKLESAHHQAAREAEADASSSDLADTLHKLSRR